MGDSKEKLIKEYGHVIDTLGNIQGYHNKKSQEAGVAKHNLQMVCNVLLQAEIKEESAGGTIAGLNATIEAYRNYLEDYSNEHVMDTTSLAVSGMSVSSTAVASLTALFTNDELLRTGNDFCVSVELKQNIAERLRGIDTRLELLYAAAFKSFYSGLPEAERTALTQMRQLLDELIVYFSPDEDVRKSKFFNEKKGNKPDQIYRAERISFAAHTLGKDNKIIDTLVAEGNQINDLYKDLNRLHTRADIERFKASATLNAAERFVELFLDVIGR